MTPSQSLMGIDTSRLGALSPKESKQVLSKNIFPPGNLDIVCMVRHAERRGCGVVFSLCLGELSANRKTVNEIFFELQLKVRP